MGFIYQEQKVRGQNYINSKTRVVFVIYNTRENGRKQVPLKKQSKKGTFDRSLLFRKTPLNIIPLHRRREVFFCRPIIWPTDALKD
ncbi:hypothetical protein L6452_08350 [Arctium lappa]|uniref:Uncharacterized protein n=1 Tax=Arctium lappa TaxID=4217 RepID=A0ACB9DHV4_ARCLA|nr:hypothetical protein L6452_08350 [Arctium lappa]